jgi:hypothetical protein
VNSGLNDFLNAKDKFLWIQVVSAMDVIEDTAMAIMAYCSTMVDEGEKGRLYLVIYGLFQVFFVQQDAVKDLCTGLEVDDIWESRDSILGEIRRIRNKAVGHPTRRGKANELSHHGLVRVELSMGKITVWSSEPDKPYEHETYYPFVLVDQQSAAISQVLSEVMLFIERLKKEVD